MFGGIVPQLDFRAVPARTSRLLQLVVWIGNVLRVLGRYLLDGLCCQLLLMRRREVRAGGVNSLPDVSSRDVRWRIRLLQHVLGRILLAG